MELIKTLDDPRLNCYRPHHHTQSLIDSLRAALTAKEAAEAENAKLNGQIEKERSDGSAMCLGWNELVEKLEKENAALQGQLCAAREALVAHMELHLERDNLNADARVKQVNDISIAALSFSPPCLHAKVAERVNVEGLAKVIYMEGHMGSSAEEIAAAIVRYLKEG